MNPGIAGQIGEGNGGRRAGEHVDSPVAPLINVGHVGRFPDAISSGRQTLVVPSPAPPVPMIHYQVPIAVARELVDTINGLWVPVGDGRGLEDVGSPRWHAQ